jgi:hypothetical protein
LHAHEKPQRFVIAPLPLSGTAWAQTTTSYLLLQGERLPSNEITVAQLQNICALQVGNDGWQMAVKPTVVTVAISSSNGTMATIKCRAGVVDAAGAKRLEKAKAGDLIFICDLGVPESVKAQVGQFALKVK